MKRRPGQFYIYYNIESPAITEKKLTDFSPLANYFNLSMTYRLKADIVYRYGRFVQLAPHPSDGLAQIIMNFAAANTHLARKVKGTSDKEVFVTQFVTKCSTPSKRKAAANCWFDSTSTSTTQGPLYLI